MDSRSRVRDLGSSAKDDSFGGFMVEARGFSGRTGGFELGRNRLAHLVTGV